MKTIPLLSCVILLLMHSAGVRSQSAVNHDQSPFCLGTEVTFDNSAVEALYLSPGELLTNVDSFWTSSGAYRLAAQYCANNRIPIDRGGWTERVRAIAALSTDERASQPALLTSDGISDLSTVLRERGFPHISSFLQPSTPPLKVTVYLISDIKPAAFAYPGGILVNVNSPRFNNDPAVIMNIIVHEIYHGGYANTVAYRSDYEIQNEALDFVMDFLLNEGMATYVSYSARHIFPNDFVPDYKMMDNNDAVKANIEKVDQLFIKAESLPIDSLRRLAWQTGVIERAFYIAGGYMAGLIDKTVGREELVMAMSSGPLSFLTLYNSLADEGMKLNIPELPPVISPAQKLRFALAREDFAEFRRLSDELIQAQNDNPADEAVEKALNRYGYMFMRSHGGTDKALELFKLNVRLFPGSSRAWDSLGEGFMVAGNNELAIENYEKSLAINPSNENARRIVEKLRQQK